MKAPRLVRRCLPLFAALALAACAPLPQRAGIPTEWAPSPNFNERRPNFVVLHHTGSGNAERALAVLRDPLLEVSAHYLIGRDGRIYQLVDERARAWHAGASRWGATTDLNSASLGIELDNDGGTPYPEAQIQALLALLADITERHRIPPANVLGHADVAPRRKVDPGRLFPWQRLAERGYGLWCFAPPPALPPAFDPVAALQAFGYDTREPEAAVAAFKLHYAPDDPDPAWTDADSRNLHCLLQQARRRPEALP
jgi:N-acetylmuramoyl-L-alanine amidase